MIHDLLATLEGWYGQEIADIWNGNPWRSRGLLMACPIWGDKYIDRFEKFGLPSIMSPQNHAALKGRCRMVLWTTKKSYARLHNITEGIEDVGFDLDLRLIPDEMMAHIPNSPDDPQYLQKQLNKYWLLGVVQNAGIQMAKRSGMAFHQLHPDHVVANNYYHNLFRLADAYEAIAQTGISADIETAGPELLEYVQDGGALTIPDRELGDIGFRHLHKQTRASLMNTATIPTDMPESHLWTWVGKDRLYLACCHANAAYLSPNLCRIAPSRIPATIDAELPSFVPDARGLYIPKADDGMTFIEVSDDTKHDNVKRVGADEFGMFCWLKTRFSIAWMPYTGQFTEVPIAPQSPDSFMTQREIKGQHAQLIDLLLKLRGPDTLATKFIEGLAFQ